MLVNVILFGNSQVKIRSLEQPLLQYDCVHLKMRHLDIVQIHIEGKGCEEMKGEYGMMHLQDKECQGWPANCQELGDRHGIDSSSRLEEGSKPANTLISNFQP